MRPGLAVAALVLFAGCGGAVLTDGGPRVTETLTPVPVVATPATEGDAETERVAVPGIAANGSVDVGTLRRAHLAFLADRTYRWRFSYHADGIGDGYSDRRSTRRVAVGDGRYLVTRSDPPPGGWQSLYVDGSGEYRRIPVGGDTEFEFARTAGSPTEYANGGELIQRYLTGLRFRVDTITRDGRTYHRVSSVPGEKPDVSEGFNAPRAVNYRATAYVTPSGLVRALVVEYDQSRIDGYYHITVRFDYTDVGGTVVDPPAWVDRVPTPSLTESRAGERNATATSTAVDRTSRATPAPRSTGRPTLDSSGAGQHSSSARSKYSSAR